MAREKGVIYSLSDVEKDYGKEFVQIYSAFKAACVAREIPMFVAFSNCSEENPLYYTDCVYAVLSMPEYGSRIGDLILAARGVETKYPEYIQRAINVLQDWIDQEKVYTGSGEENTLIRQYEDIAGGRMVPTLFPEGEYEVVEGVKKTDKKPAKKAKKKAEDEAKTEDQESETPEVKEEEAPKKKRGRPRKAPEE